MPYRNSFEAVLIGITYDHMRIAHREAVRRRFLMVGLSLLLSVSLAACGASRLTGVTAHHGATASDQDCAVSALLVPSCGAWWGITPGAFTPAQGKKALTEFEDKIGRPVDIYHAYHRSPQLFPTKEEIGIASRPGKQRLLYLSWKPEMGHTWAEVAAGAHEVDKQIDNLAGYINNNFTKPFFLAIHHEPENEVVPKKGSGFTAKDYRAMFRHVVKRLRADDVDNAVIVMNYMGAPKWCVKPWFDELYPGDDVVDWIGYDPYAEDSVSTFADLVNLRYPWVDGWEGFYHWATQKYPDKPLMLAEWGVLPVSGKPKHKAEVFRSMAKHVKDYPALDAFIYFSAPKADKGDTTVDGTKASLEAYRDLGHMSYLNPSGPTYDSPHP